VIVEAVTERKTVPADAPTPKYAVRTCGQTHKMMDRLLDGMKRGTLLDIAAGDGPLSAAVAALGYEVTACDLRPERFQAPGLTCVRCNLDERLPFEDSSFDYLIVAELEVSSGEK